ncbi:DEAD/DEAH box helicase [Rapidithrix thailandica]|uniref:DEAD/DEAH box helicase n=1 Tax=Rapidithrix thailandica TaxID=413964 RepID=A0AAW9SCV7_9BACT
MEKKLKRIQPLINRLQINELNSMQLASLKAAERHQNFVLLSPTGSGKTLAFLLPMLLNLREDRIGVQALILVPSRELALQIEQVWKAMGSGFKVNTCYGGHSVKIELNNFQDPPAVLVGTPGRVADHLQRKSFDPALVHTLIMDEFDKALELGFQKDMEIIIQRLTGVKNKILTSATQTQSVPAFTGLKSPYTLDYTPSVKTNKQLEFKAVRSEGTDKLEALFRLICLLGNSPTLVFCNHRAAVDRISELLLDQGLVHEAFHGGLKQDERERTLTKFRNGSSHLLITTDLASRGLDIPEIQQIIHYQLPQTETAFVHRNGRTARMHANGSSYLVLAEKEPILPYLKQKPEFISLPESLPLPAPPDWDTIYFSGGKKDKINKTDIVGLVLKKGKLQHDELGLIEVKDYVAYAAVKRDKAAQLVRKLKHEKVKKKKLKIEIAR